MKNHKRQPLLDVPKPMDKHLPKSAVAHYHEPKAVAFNEENPPRNTGRDAGIDAFANDSLYIYSLTENF